MTLREKIVIKNSLKDYLKKINSEFKVNERSLCNCPSKCSNEPTAKLINEEIHCLNPKCNKVFNIFDIVKIFRPQFEKSSEDEITNYLIHLLKIEIPNDEEDLLNKYFQAGFYLFPLAPGSKKPIEGFSWTEQSVHNLTVWNDWLSRGYGLALKLGRDSNVVAVDFDALQTYEKFQDKIGDTLIQGTERGHHALYNYDPIFTKTLNRILRNDGYEMELRTEGAYIVIAPTSVNGEIRKWNNGKIIPMPQELKSFFLSYYDKEPKQEKIDDEIQKAITENNLGNAKLSGLNGCCNDTFVKVGGILRKKLASQQVEYALYTFNQLLSQPMPNKDIKAMVRQIEKYEHYDKTELAKVVLERLDIVKEGSAFQIAKAMNYEQKDIEEVLSYLESENKIIDIGRNRYRRLEQLEWITGFDDYSVPLDFQVPYFSQVAYFDKGNMILIGGQTGSGKTTITANFIKKLSEQPNIKSVDLISTEAGSKIGKVLESLKIRTDFVHRPKTLFKHPADIELRDNSITLIDWLRPRDGDFAKLDNTMEHLHNQLRKHGGFLIVFVQLRASNDQFFASDQIHNYTALSASYHYGNKTDNINTFFQTHKIRDSKTGQQKIVVPTIYNASTRELDLK